MAPRFPYEAVRDGLGQNALTCSPDLMMAQRYFDLRDRVNQFATVGLHGQVSPPANPHLDHMSAQETYITWTFKIPPKSGTGEILFPK